LAFLLWGKSNVLIIFVKIIKTMNTTLVTPSIGAFHPQFVRDTVGKRLVVLPQDEFEALMKEKAQGLSLADTLAKESRAVQMSSAEVLREFEAIEV
jgi:hypothetical protein